MDSYTSSINESFETSAIHDQDCNDLILRYLQSEKKMIVSLQEALDRRDYSKLISLGDMVHGHGWSFGFGMISRIGKAIELSAKFQAHDQLAVLIFDLSSYIDFLLSQK